jgi:hypothetical protein
MHGLWDWMIDIESVKLLTQITSTTVAFIALFIGLRNERRSEMRFQEQLNLSRRVAEANARPLLATYINGYEDEKGLVLVNHGSGTAVISDIKFVLGDRSASCAADVIDLPREVIWEECPDLSGGEFISRRMRKR